MSLFSKKALYLALFMVVAVGFYSFADTETDLEALRAALAEMEAEYAEAEAALEDAKFAVLEAKSNLAEAEDAYAEAETLLRLTKLGLDMVKEAIAELEASSSDDAVVSVPGTETPAGAVAVNDTKPVPAASTERGDIPDSIRRNEYFLESERLLALAQEAYSTGDYDSATFYAEEAARLARLSDEYIAQQTGSGVLPAIYTVREWDTHGDCFWNIAGYPWVYNNPRSWRVLYEANKEKLPNPNNPNLVEPGTVLTIPSIRGETRQGEWVSGRTYDPLR
jgi:nucleoid-associated protein YgaU